MQYISLDVINIFFIYSMFILRICQLFIGEFIILFILLFLLRRKASQISKIQKRIRLLYPNWTRKTLNNVTDAFFPLFDLHRVPPFGVSRHPCHA